MGVWPSTAWSYACLRCLSLTHQRLQAQGYLSVNYSDNYFFLSQRHPEVPRLTPAQLEAMKLFNQLAASDALRMEANLEPGDIQLLNNHTQVSVLTRLACS